MIRDHPALRQQLLIIPPPCPPPARSQIKGLTKRLKNVSA